MFPVITPVEVLIDKLVLDAAHVPLDVMLVAVILLPIQTLLGPAIAAGLASTVTVLEVVQPEVLVKVMLLVPITRPAAMPVVELIDTIETLELAQVPDELLV